MPTKIEINIRTFITAIVLLVVGYLSYQLLGIFLILFVAFILFSSTKPLVDYLERKGVKRMIAIILTYISIIASFLIIFYFIFTQSVTQVKNVVQDFRFNSDNIVLFVDQNLPFLSDDVRLRINDLENNLNSSDIIENLTTNSAFKSILESLGTVGNQGFKLIGNVIGGLFTIFMVLFISIYMVAPRNDFYEGALKYFPKRHFNRINKVLDKIKTGLGSWLVGQFILMFIIGLATYIIIALPGLFISGYEIGKFAFLIAVIAGLLEAIPNIGPIITLVIAVLLAVLVGSPAGIIIYLIISFTLLQQAEGLFLVPSVMKRAIELNPIISILAILAGFELTGSPIGALLAVPIVGTLQIIILDILDNWKKD